VGDFWTTPARRLPEADTKVNVNNRKLRKFFILIIEDANLDVLEEVLRGVL